MSWWRQGDDKLWTLAIRWCVRCDALRLTTLNGPLEWYVAVCWRCGLRTLGADRPDTDPFGTRKYLAFGPSPDDRQ